MTTVRPLTGDTNFNPRTNAAEAECHLEPQPTAEPSNAEHPFRHAFNGQPADRIGVHIGGYLRTASI
jgi:hypothetical protein